MQTPWRVLIGVFFLTPLIFGSAFSTLFAGDVPQKKIVVGTTVGDFGDMVKDCISAELEKKGYQVKLVEFSDYMRPNLALVEGSLDVNIFQHKLYLEEFARAHHLELTPLFQVPTAPLGIYAGRSKALNEIKKGSRIALPSDPTNLGRGLRLLADLGWIQIAQTTDLLRISLQDIQENRFELKFLELEAAQLPRSRSSVDFAIINGNFATASGIPLTEALFQEKGDRFLNWGVVRTKDLQSPFAKDLVEVYRSQEFRSYIHARFPGYQTPADWRN